MKILIIGGSYFLGKTFTMLASEEHELYLLNRGNQPWDDEYIVEYVMDRHDADAIETIAEDYFDVIVDFCAYKKGDIEFILEHLKAKVTQYIFVSTVDVYERGLDGICDENAPLESRMYGGAAGEYIAGKVALEQEIVDACIKRGIAYTTIRPAFIYGPDNYAPRENIYFKWILTASQIIHPVNATGNFQTVFVLDVARAIMLACNNSIAYNKAYNICNEECMNYESYADLLEIATELPFEKVEMSVEDIMERQIPLPFPLTQAESLVCSSARSLELGMTYTPIERGMAITFDYYQNA